MSTPSPAAATVQVGCVIDRYRIESILGQGGMATIYKAVHETLGSEHAIKVLNVHSGTVRERLLAEGRVQARIRHANLVAVTDVITVSGVPSLVMEFVDGPTLEAWLAENRPTFAEALAIFRGIVEGVGAAHRQGRVHRDLKPANVLLATVGRGTLQPKVTDFGLVKLLDEEQSMNPRHTLPGLGLGTPQYMSPQQIEDASTVDQRTDMFSLGCLLYELICGRRAFDGPDHLAIYNAVVSGTYLPVQEVVPEVPTEIVVAIDRLLQPDPMRRIANCDVLIEILYGAVPDSGRFLVPEGQERSVGLEAKLTPIMSPRRTISESESEAPPVVEDPGPDLKFATGFGVFTLVAAAVAGLVGIVFGWATGPVRTADGVPEAPGTELAEILGVRAPRPEPVDTKEAETRPPSARPKQPEEMTVDEAKDALREARAALQEARRRERDLEERIRERDEAARIKAEEKKKLDRPRVGFP